MAATIKLNGIKDLTSLRMTRSWYVPQEEQREGAARDDSMNKA
jgi:hypothetical protein